MDMSKDFEIRRQQIWVEAWVMTAQSDSCLSVDIPTKYADKCLKEFDKRFKPPIEYDT